MFNRRGFSIPGLPAPAPGEENNAEFRVVTPDYFRTMGIRLLKGRFFNAAGRDRDRAEPEAAAHPLR